jgi:polar amino acid transport system permease protein
MAYALLSKHRPLRVQASVYVTVIRNTPILVLILLIYFALPSLGIRLDKIPSFIITLSLYAGAYLTEVFRGGLLSIPKGQREAGLAIGLGEWQVKAYVTVPVMLRNVLPALSNNFISLFKDTSLAAAIAVPELTYYARKINVESYRVIETWLVTTALYVAACYLIAMLLRYLEQRLAIRR